MAPPWTSSPSFPSQTPLVLFPSQKTWESWSYSLQSLLALNSCGVSLAVSRLQGGAALSQPWDGTALAFPQHSHFLSLPSQPWLWSPQPCPVLAATASMLVAKRNFHTSPMDHAWALSSGTKLGLHGGSRRQLCGRDALSCPSHHRSHSLQCSPSSCEAYA